MTKVKYASKKNLYPAFGESDMKNQIALVRKDLPKIVKRFVRDHELYHLKDKSQNVLWREIKAKYILCNKTSIRVCNNINNEFTIIQN